MAGIEIVVNAESGRTIYAVAQKLTGSGLGDVWNVVAAAWQAAPSAANRKITLAESAQVLGTYAGSTVNLASYSGWVVVSIHDGVTDECLDSDSVYSSAGNESRYATGADVLLVPAATRSYLQSNQIDVANMRGTDNAFLAANWVAPDNAGITAIQSTQTTHTSTLAGISSNASAAKNASEAVDGKLPADTTTKINRLDATVSSRSVVTDASIRTYLQSNQIDVANMRGTDNAFLAASWVAPDNSGIATAAADATAAKTAAQAANGKLPADTATKIGFIPSELVAAQSDITAVQNTLKPSISGVVEQQVPAAGSKTLRFHFTLTDSDGAYNDPDSNLVTWTAANQAGTDRSVNLSGSTREAAGRYYVDYTVGSAHAIEQVTVTASFTESSTASRVMHTVNMITAISVGGFTSGDRAELDAIYSKLPSKAYLTGTANADGDVDLDDATGDRTQFKADQTSVINAARDAVISQGNSAWVTATGFLATGDSRLNNLDATISSRATVSALTTVGNNVTTIISDIAALEIHGDATWATATGFLTSVDARLNNLDATISSRSTFDHTANQVTLAAGHGLATAANQTAIKAKTDLLPADPAGVSNVPTVGAIATQVNATLTTAHGSGAWTGGGDATEAKQDTIITQLSSIGAVSVLSANMIDDSRTWYLTDRSEKSLAPQVITLLGGDVVELAMDFAAFLNPGTTLATVVSATDSASLLTISDLSVSQDKVKAHFKVDDVTAGGEHTIKVVVTTSDGQTLSGLGNIRVDSDSPLTGFGINNICIGV